MRGIKNNVIRKNGDFETIYFKWEKRIKYAVREKGAERASGYDSYADKIILFDSLGKAIEYADYNNRGSYSVRGYIEEVTVWVRIEKIEIKGGSN